MHKLTYVLLIISIDWLLKLGQYFETYIFHDWGFIKYLGILIVVDTLIGIYKAKKQKKFSWKKLGKLQDKLITYISILVLVHVITSFTVEDKVVTLFHWIRLGALSGIMAKEAVSILKNLAAVNKSFIPIWILKKLEAFDKSGKFDDEEPKNDTDD